MAYNKEDAKNLVLLEVENYKKVLELYNPVIEVAEKYDGKILNKRFETALRKVNDSLRVDMSGKKLSIDFYLTNRGIKSTTHEHWNYINKSYITMNEYTERCAYEWESLDGKSLCADHENRLIASVLVESLNKHREYIKGRIETLEEKLNKVDEYKNQLEELKTQMEKITKDIPYEIRNYFELNYNVYNNR